MMGTPANFVNFLINVFLGLHQQHMEVPRLGVESELQLLVYTTAIARRDPNPLARSELKPESSWIHTSRGHFC